MGFALRHEQRLIVSTISVSNKECNARMRSGQLLACDAMLLSEDVQRGARALAEKRDPVWKGE
jgi:hypothetical protein